MLIWMIPIFSLAQVELSEKPKFISISKTFGSFQPHTPKIEKYRGTNPSGFEVEWSRWNLSQKALEASGTFAKLSFSAGYVDFDHPDLGYSLYAMASIEPFLIVKPKFRVSLKGGAGVSWLSTVYDAQDNPDNLMFSTNFAFPLSMGAALYYNFHSRLGLRTELGFRHFSNGGVRLPNLGINYYSMGLGLEYAIDPYVIPEKSKRVPVAKTSRYDFIGGYTIKEDTAKINNRSVFTLIAQRFRQRSRIHGTVMGTQIEYHETTERKTNPFNAGIFLGNEFLMGQFRFGQQMGLYFIKGSDARNLLFQNYYLRWFIEEKYILGIHLKVHGRVADYLGVQIGRAVNR